MDYLLFLIKNKRAWSVPWDLHEYFVRVDRFYPTNKVDWVESIRWRPGEFLFRNPTYSL